MKKIHFIQYRKLKNLTIEFDNNVNLIAGTNGTCKSSILHLISNSYQKIPIKESNDILKTIQKINKVFNPKIESLTRGDKEYNDPAIGVKGTLYTTYYNKGYSIDFRRHNSKRSNDTARFAVKPKYRKDQTDKLPKLPIIYLGMFRLIPYGEWEGNNKFTNIVNKLPEQYLEEISDLYREFTGYEIIFDGKLNKLDNIKTKLEFSTASDGIDSNTISAGEDNLLTIITSLVSLKAYSENTLTPTTTDISSILLIDELDASLHPEFQIKLLEKFYEYSTNYNIQIFFTTHSFSLIEHSLNKKRGVLNYLIDQYDSVDILPEPNIYSINALLQNKTVNQIYKTTKIPVLLEDDEAKDFFKHLLDNYYEHHSIPLNQFFHIVDAKLSSEAIKMLATDTYMKQSTLRTVSIVDGDQRLDNKALSYNLISLPGQDSPEELLFNYLSQVLMDDEEFWKKDDLISCAYTKKYVQQNIISQINSLKDNLENSSDSKHGKKREGNKKIYNTNKEFFNYVIKYWIDNQDNSKEVDNFFINLQKAFHKVAPFHNIDPKTKWPFPAGQKS